MTTFAADVVGEGTVHWLSADTTVSVVYSNGLVSSRAAGSTSIRAVLDQDTRHSGSAELVVTPIQTDEIIVQLEAFTRASTRNIADANALTGAVDIHVMVKAASDVAELQLVVDGVVAGSRAPAATLEWLLFTLDTTQLSNGGHQLALRLQGSSGQQLAVTPAIAIRIVN